MCCPGCAAVADVIEKEGLGDYYSHRTANPKSLKGAILQDLDQLLVYDHEAIQRTFVVVQQGSVRQANLALEGIECAACIWLNERHLRSLPGVSEVSINYSTQQASVTWDNESIHLSDILAAIHAIGYKAHPFDANRQQIVLAEQRKTLLRQIGVAAALGMQVMILTVALYAGDWYGMEAEFEQFFRRVALLLTLPVLVYSGRSFFKNAITDLRLKRVGMDVPVSIGIGLAFLASTWHVISGEGAVYFESVCMFILFLLAARYFELSSRMRAMRAAQGIGAIKPLSARRLLDGNITGRQENVAAIDLKEDDLVVIRPGDTIAADGVVVSGESGIDESILTGESLPVSRGPGQPVIGGSINTRSPLVVRVTRVGNESLLAEIDRLLSQAFAEKPAIGQLADRVAAYFVATILVLAVLVAIFWFLHGEPRWLAITISVLVVSCPCALSLAVPTAISATIARLMRDKILVTSETALETLPKTTLFVFDKTGTLTLGKPAITRVDQFKNGHQVPQNPGDNDRLIHIAAALESGSEHPMAQAFMRAVGNDAELSFVESAKSMPGAGVCGRIDGCNYWLGNPALIESQTSATLPDGFHSSCIDSSESEIFLATDSEVMGRFHLRDELRPDSKATIDALEARGMKTILLSGDDERVARAVADELGMDEVIADCTPADKLDAVKRWQSAGEIVTMVGDGINDAPVLAGANVSFSTHGASAMAISSADIVSLSKQIYAVVSTYDCSKRTLTIMKQNLIWAIGYNALAVPAAALGLVAPWLAALGMSLSSLIVISNATRLKSG